MFEEFTEKYFREQARALGDEMGVDTRDGSIYMDMAAGHCIRAAFFFANLEEVFTMFALDTCYGDALDDKAAEFGLTRHPATEAVFNATFVGTQPSAGDRFFADDTEYYFMVVEDEDDNTLRLECETEGTEPNTLSAGTVITPVDDIDGLEEAYLGEIYTAGTDEETDDALRTRLREKIAGPAENGNRQHYKTWCESVDGVGRAKIIPLFAGENTVRAILYSPEGLPCDADVVDAVQEYVDPITQNYEFEDADHNTWICGDGWGDGVANLGAHFLASAATAHNITVSFTVTLRDGGSLADCKTATEEAVTAYLKTLALETDADSPIIVRIAYIGSLITDLPMVLDYTDLELNGDTSNITVDADDVPVLEEVNIVASS